MSYTGRTALVTGGASGIGRAVVSRLLQDGANVSFCDYNKVTGEALAKELSAIYGEKVLFHHCDVRDNSQLEDCFNCTKSKFSGLDIVVNNAGVGNETDWGRHVDINLKGVIRGTHLALKHMGRSQGGSGGVVVNIGSTTCLETFPGVPVYSSIKAAVNRLSLCYGDDLYYSRSGVKVICLNPGLTVTSLSESFDDTTHEDYIGKSISECLATYIPQSAEYLADCLVELLDKAESGTLWVVRDGKPAVQVKMEAH